jgi:hypothetical protein
LELEGFAYQQMYNFDRANDNFIPMGMELILPTGQKTIIE